MTFNGFEAGLLFWTPCKRIFLQPSSSFFSVSLDVQPEDLSKVLLTQHSPLQSDDNIQ